MASSLTDKPFMERILTSCPPLGHATPSLRDDGFRVRQDNEIAMCELPGGLRLYFSAKVFAVDACGDIAVRGNGIEAFGFCCHHWTASLPPVPESRLIAHSFFKSFPHHFCAIKSHILTLHTIHLVCIQGESALLSLPLSRRRLYPSHALWE